MKVILNQDVVSLGDEGAVVQVANGYARNYLIPRKLAVPFTEHNQHLLLQRKRGLELRREQKRVDAQGMKERIQSLALTISAPAGDSGRLFGSVGPGTIADELARQGVEVDRRRIVVPEHHLREVGEHTVRIRLFGDEEATLKVTIEKSKA